MRPTARRSINRDQGQTRRHRPDYILLLASILLLSIGLIVVYAISPGLSVQRNVGENYFVSKQIIAALLGMSAFAVAAWLPIESWRKSQNILIGMSVIAAIAVQLFGEKVNGAYRWVHIGGLSFQAVELIKLAVLIWLAGFLSDRIRTQTLKNAIKTQRPILILLAAIAVVVAIFESDLGSTAVLIAMIGAMSFVAGMPLKRVAIIGGVVVAAVVLLISTTPYRRDRFLTFMHPERDCLNTGYQACQALIAVGSGGLFGKGLARSVQAYGYLPEAANDSIFAIYAEKFGFVGVVLLLLIFGLLFSRLKNILERTPDDFSRLIVVGVLAWLSTQTIINVGAMIGLLPLKGITLPFVSYGGTSIIFVSVAVGLAFNISRYTSYGQISDEGENRRKGAGQREYRSTYAVRPR